MQLKPILLVVFRKEADHGIAQHAAFETRLSFQNALYGHAGGQSSARAEAANRASGGVDAEFLRMGKQIIEYGVGLLKLPGKYVVRGEPVVHIKDYHVQRVRQLLTIGDRKSTRLNSSHSV